MHELEQHNRKEVSQRSSVGTKPSSCMTLNTCVNVLLGSTNREHLNCSWGGG